MPNQLIDEAMSHLLNAKDLMIDPDNKENLEKSIQQLNVAMNKIVVCIPAVIKMIGPNQTDLRTNEKRNEKIRRAALVKKMMNEGLSNKIISQRLGMAHTNITLIKKDIEQFKDDPHFLQLMKITSGI